MSPSSLPDLLWHAAEAQPGGVAVVDGERQLSYRELALHARRMAGLLGANGVGVGDRVGVHLEKSADAVTALYGILAAGAAYVPLDPDAPPARTATILRDCDVRVLVSGATKARDWPALLAEGAPIATLVVPDVPAAAEIDLPETVMVLAGTALESQAEGAPLPTVTVSDLAYVLYTSGSTGDPKGACLTHGNALAFVEWAAAEFELQRGDRLSSHAPFHFDLSVFDLYAAAAVGATVVLVPDGASVFPREIGRFIECHGITVWYSVPRVLAELAERAGLEAGSLPTLRAVLFAGEPFPVRQLRRLMTLLPGARFFNLYGPTECNVCTSHEVGDLGDDDTDIPIGRAISGVEVRVVDDRGHRAGPGGVGELFVQGPTVMQGYWGDPERSAAALVADPLGGGGRERWLRTGDFAEVLRDGTLRFRGRHDAQVKHRGFRVELGDVEAALGSHPAVADCAVVVAPDDRVGSRLIAYVVMARPIDSSELRQSCIGLLPRHMIPDHIAFVATLPRTSTGKLDRRALAVWRSSRDEPRSVVRP